MNTKKIYIATPVTSRPEGTLHAKRAAADARVSEVLHLAEEWLDKRDYSKFREYCGFWSCTKPEMTDAQAMGACIKQLLECDLLVVDDAADGYDESKGVAAELAVAEIYGIEAVLASTLN